MGIAIIIHDIDVKLLLLVNSHHTPFLDTIMWFASGELSWLPFYLALTVFFIIKYKKYSMLLIALVPLLIVLSDQLASGLVKPLVHRLRPSHEPGLQNLLHYVHDYHGGTYGFMSSHACNVFALAAYVAAATRIKWLSWLLFAWAVFVSYSRVYLGVHYPSDVIVPAVLGIIIGLLIAKLYTAYKIYFMIKHNKTA